VERHPDRRPGGPPDQRQEREDAGLGELGGRAVGGWLRFGHRRTLPVSVSTAGIAAGEGAVADETECGHERIRWLPGTDSPTDPADPVRRFSLVDRYRIAGEPALLEPLPDPVALLGEEEA